MTRLAELRLYRIDMPLVRPFRTSFGTQDTRDVLLLQAITNDGISGWAECVAMEWPGYSYEYVDGAVDVLAEHLIPAAVADGTITKVYSVANDKLAGNGVRLTTANGTYFFYGHFKSVAEGITVGTKVKAGQVIGYNGKTGGTNTPHLHFEVHPLGGEAIDPTDIVAAVDACSVTTPRPAP